MAGKHAQREKELNARELHIHFSPQVKDAFRSLANATVDSREFDGDIHAVLKGFAGEKSFTLHDVMISLPAIAEEMAAHVHVSSDPAAKDAWRDLCDRMLESGFTVSQARSKQR